MPARTPVQARRFKRLLIDAGFSLKTSAARGEQNTSLRRNLLEQTGPAAQHRACVRFLWRCWPVAALHLCGVGRSLLATEHGPVGSRFPAGVGLCELSFSCSLLPRPGVSAALALSLVVLFDRASRFKSEILQLSLDIPRFPVIDRDTFSFLLFGVSAIAGRS